MFLMLVLVDHNFSVSFPFASPRSTDYSNGSNAVVLFIMPRPSSCSEGRPRFWIKDDCVVNIVGAMIWQRLLQIGLDVVEGIRFLRSQ